MPTPRLGDVIVRHQDSSTAVTSYVIVDPVIDLFLSGPFSALSDAVNSAERRLGPDGRIWHEEVDQRGRSVGPLLLLPSLSR